MVKKDDMRVRYYAKLYDYSLWKSKDHIYDLSSYISWDNQTDSC